MNLSIHPDGDGPIFDGRAEKIIHNACQDMEDDVADWANNAVHRKLHEVLKHPTGYYESRVITDRSGAGVEVVGDNVIYGPWLEGVGERNRNTRFKGYFTFRQVAQETELISGEISERIMDRRDGLL